MQNRQACESANDLIDTHHKDMLKILTDSMDINYSVMDTNGNVVATNNSFKKRFPNLNQLSNGEVWESCSAVMNTRERVCIEEEYEGRYYLSIKQPLIEKNKCTGVIVLSFDITAQKQSEIAKREFLTNISHDIKTPFMGISTLSELLIKKEKDISKKKNLEIIHKCSLRLYDFLNTSLKKASLDSHNLNDDIEFNVLEEIHSTIDMIFPLAKLKNLQIKVNVDDKIIKINKVYFNEIFLNIVSNAVKFSHQGAIKIETVFDKKSLTLSVSDEGIGISKDNQLKVFDQFYRVKQSHLEPEFRGCGIGLYNAKVLTEKLGGKITLESELDKGSTFSVIIPLKEI